MKEFIILFLLDLRTGRLYEIFNFIQAASANYIVNFSRKQMVGTRTEIFFFNCYTICVKAVLKTKWFYVVLALLGASLGIFIFFFTRDAGPARTTDVVTRGEITHIVSVSGTVQAENTAELTFPATGIVAEVFVHEGDVVTKDQILSTLEHSDLFAERQDAVAALAIAEANRDELVRGPRSEERDVTDITVQIAKENLARTMQEEREKVENAYRTLLSDDLEAYPIDTQNNDVPPVITGTYVCGKEGAYALSIFGSNARSGHSYRLNGLETGTFSAYTESPAPLGTCGLFIQFDGAESYRSDDWEILIPNTRGDSYTINLNAYLLARKLEETTVAAARQALQKAESEYILENADPREEARVRAEAAVMQAGARLSVIDARIADHTLRAPFAGTVSAVHVVHGEVADTISAITLVANDIFELTVRIPEIDITRIAVGQHADIVFDARPEEVISSTISFVSPMATEIDGVAYFEAKLRFDNPPAWLRGGLNADVDIVTERREWALRIPKRFLAQEGDTSFVLVPEGESTARVPVTVGFTGNDGFVEITGLSEGATVVAP